MLKWLSKADTGADVVVRWATIIGLMVGGYTWLASKLPWFGEIGLAEMIAIAIPAALVTLLAVTASLALYRYFRPLSPSGSQYGPSLPLQGYDDSAIRHEIVEIRSGLDETKAHLAQTGRDIAETLSNHQKLLQLQGGLEARFDGALDGLKESIQQSDETKRSNFEALQERVGRLEALIQEETERRRRSFWALQAREYLKELAAEIEFDAGLLYDRLASGEVYDRNAWDKWESVHAVWNMRLQSWLDSAKWYAPDLLAKVLQFPDSAYAGEWSVRDDQFPDAEAVRKFKRHRIINSQWNETREVVKHGLDLVAFSGLSDDEVRRGKHPEA